MNHTAICNKRFWKVFPNGFEFYMKKWGVLGVVTLKRII